MRWLPLKYQKIRLSKYAIAPHYAGGVAQFFRGPFGPGLRVPPRVFNESRIFSRGSLAPASRAILTASFCPRLGFPRIASLNIALRSGAEGAGAEGNSRWTSSRETKTQRHFSRRSGSWDTATKTPPLSDISKAFQSAADKSWNRTSPGGFQRDAILSDLRRSTRFSLIGKSANRVQDSSSSESSKGGSLTISSFSIFSAEGTSARNWGGLPLARQSIRVYVAPGGLGQR